MEIARFPETHVAHYSGLLAGIAANKDGRNILEALREITGKESNSVEEIEISYDLQSGSYSHAASVDIGRWQEYGAALSEHLSPHTVGIQTFLDCGAGELTSLTSIAKTGIELGEVFAIDLSWSRLATGRKFMSEYAPSSFCPHLISGDIHCLPFSDSSIDVVTTIHALEPNGGQEIELLSELFRVASRKIVLFEPCFERSSKEVQDRMKSHGYIRNLEKTILDLGGVVDDVVLFENSANPLNPTWVFTISPPKSRQSSFSLDRVIMQCPITGTPLIRKSDWFRSAIAGLAYPILEEISLLRPKNAILATAFAAPADI
jgi:ubiquinone/menaquinone biosynthesis C-methylase UbiE